MADRMVVEVTVVGSFGFVGTNLSKGFAHPNSAKMSGKEESEFEVCRSAICNPMLWSVSVAQYWYRMESYSFSAAATSVSFGIQQGWFCPVFALVGLRGRWCWVARVTVGPNQSSFADVC